VSADNDGGITGGLAEGTILGGRYRLGELLGRGGMGEVFRAVQLSIEREVAVKVLRTDGFKDDETREVWLQRFRREAEVLSTLKHPNTVTVYDFGKTREGHCYIVMELLSGRTLLDVLRQEGPMTSERAVSVTRQICMSLAEAHEQGIVHRDLKPENIFLTRYQDGSDWVKVMDFGVAKLLARPDEAVLTRPGSVFGTPAYMSPEQASGEMLSPRSDIYSVGILLYTMLTGKPPFWGGTAAAILMQHANDPPPRMDPERLREPVPPAVEKSVMQCLEKSPEERPQSAAELLRLLGGPDQSERPHHPWEATSEEFSGDVDGHSTTVVATAEGYEAAQKPRRSGSMLRWAVGAVLLCLLLAGLVLTRLFLGDMAVEMVTEQVQSAESVRGGLESWQFGRNVVDLLFSDSQVCQLDARALAVPARKVKKDRETCEEVDLKVVTRKVGESCLEQEGLVHALLPVARMCHACSCKGYEDLEGQAKTLVDESSKVAGVESAEAFHEIGRCYYRRVSGKDFGTPEEREQFLSKALTWSHNAIVSLDDAEETGLAIRLRMRAMVNASNALQLLGRFVDAERRLRTALELLDEKQDSFYREDFDRVSSPLFLKLGSLLTEWGTEAEWDEALTGLRKAELYYGSRDDKNGRAYQDRVGTALGILYLQMGRYSKAQAGLRRVADSRAKRLAKASESKRARRTAELSTVLVHLALVEAQCWLQEKSCGKDFGDRAGNLLERFSVIDAGLLDDPAVRGLVNLVRAMLARSAGKPGESSSHLQDALLLFGSSGYPAGRTPEFFATHRGVLQRTNGSPQEVLAVQEALVRSALKESARIETYNEDAGRMPHLRKLLRLEWTELKSMCERYGKSRPCKALEPEFE